MIRVPMAVPQASGGDGEARTQVRCLVVDDHAAVREGVKMILTRDREISVIGESSSGDGAVEMAEKRRPDVIVMDVRMPRLNGYQFVRAMRGDPETAEIPIIILSALVQDHEQLAGFLSGADVYLLKPVQIIDLMAAIDTAIKRTAEQRAEQLRLLADEL